MLRAFIFLNILIFSCDGINKTGNEEFGQYYNVRRLLQNLEPNIDDWEQAINEICNKTDMYNDGCNDCKCNSQYRLAVCTKVYCPAYDNDKCDSKKKYENGSKSCVCVIGMPPMCYTPSINTSNQKINRRSSNSKSNWPVLYRKLQKEDAIEAVKQICSETDTFSDGCNECQCNVQGMMAYCPGNWCPALDNQCESDSTYQEGSKKCVCVTDIPPLCYTPKGRMEVPTVFPRRFQTHEGNKGPGEPDGYPEDYQQSTEITEGPGEPGGYPNDYQHSTERNEGPNDPGGYPEDHQQYTERNEGPGEPGGYPDDYQQSTERNEGPGEPGGYPDDYQQSTERNEGPSDPGGYPEDHQQYTERNEGPGEPGGYPDDYQQSTDRNEGPGEPGGYPDDYQQSTERNEGPGEYGDYIYQHSTERNKGGEYGDNQQVSSSSRINRENLSKAIIEICKETEMYNDGCNDCECSGTIGVGICTRKWCSAYENERCNSSSKYSDGRRKCVCVTGIPPLCYLPTPNIYKGGDINSYRIAMPTEEAKKDTLKKSGRRIKGQG